MQCAKPNFFCSSIGSKFLMALTGLFLIFFVLMHLLGNLEIFFGRDAMNEYGVFLRSFPKALWALRIILIISFVLHIYLSIKLSAKNRAARPTPYAVSNPTKATFASRTMLLSGLVLISFVLFHLCQLTWGYIFPEYSHLLDEKGRHDIYNMTVLGFQAWYVALFYMVAQIFLFLHISHGFASAAQTLGLTSNVSLANNLRVGGRIFAAVICLSYVAIPLSVWLGVVRPEL